MELATYFKTKVGIEFVYPTEDVEGNRITKLRGAIVELRAPGAADGEAKRVGLVPFPQQKATLELPDDGAWAVRLVILSAGGVESLPGAWSEISVDRQPAMPAHAPLVHVPDTLPVGVYDTNNAVLTSGKLPDTTTFTVAT